MSGSHETTRRWVQVARILRPRGNKGEVAAELLTDFPERFSSVKYVYLGRDEQEPQPVALLRSWVDRNHPGQVVFHFEASNSISDAEGFRGLDVFLPFQDRVTLVAGQYFVTDLIGCTVFEVGATETKLASPPCSAEEAPQVVGPVRDVYFPGESVAGTPLLQVDTAQGELLVPLAEDICIRIDVLGRRIEVRLLEGLNELNAPE